MKGLIKIVFILLPVLLLVNVMRAGNSKGVNCSGHGNLYNDTSILTLSPEILPLHRLDLHISVRQEKVQLKWIAENELNTYVFMIQKSVDGINYVSIGSASTKGPINSPTEYLFSDDTQGGEDQRVFYRIMAKDKGNRVAYSNICQIKFNNQRGISVWPTLFDEAIRISYYSSTAGKISADLCDNEGRVVWENNFTITRGYNQLSATELDLLTPGVYYFNLRDNTTDRSFQQKIVKQ
jgi:hypothetical protein